ncbi:MAG TPA: M64 family metallopeptidase [Candidatus Polarisedimenticolia bacterium]|nr:M64 family metallopeptidase [Candidatus Polarisedimenticolia bacterium]
MPSLRDVFPCMLVGALVVLQAPAVAGTAPSREGAAAASTGAAPAPAPAQGTFEDWSDGAILRLDLQHGGMAKEETFALDGLRREGAWPGSRRNLVDPLNLGPYRFEVRDRATNRVLYAQGFASIYGEWESTDEAASRRRSFQESLRFPFPRRPVQVTLAKRGADNAFREVASFLVDPAAQDIRRKPITAQGKVWTIFENGPAENHVDLLVLGDGYTATEMATFHEDAKRLVGILFATPPFRERKGDFNVRAIDRPSEDSGVDRPSDGVFRRSALNVTYDIFGSERYALTLDNQALRETAAQAPYEFIEILINGEKYGGGGIYNLFATCATRSGSTPYIFVHEFGHHFAALADEYYTSEVAFDTTTPIVEPWEPNITAFLDPPGLKWKELVDPKTTLPTPWGKEEFDTYEAAIQKRRKEIRARHAPEAEMDALFKEELEWTRPFLARQDRAGVVGLFEGAGYRGKGLYRSSTDCIMFTRNPERFCPVCARAIGRVVDWVTGRP